LLLKVILIERPSDEVSQRALSLFARNACRLIELRGEVSVRITSSQELQALNRRFRGKNKPTDVLSFPSDVPETAGDIAISRDIAAANAKALGHTLTTELKVLILHGLLHLAGYDHESDNGKMLKCESELREYFNLPPSLTERTRQSPGISSGLVTGSHAKRARRAGHGGERGRGRRL
jgi:probable rRNA maturation factor